VSNISWTSNNDSFFPPSAFIPIFALIIQHVRPSCKKFNSFKTSGSYDDDDVIEMDMCPINLLSIKGFNVASLVREAVAGI
jgi:hypothetical protein